LLRIYNLASNPLGTAIQGKANPSEFKWKEERKDKHVGNVSRAPQMRMNVRKKEVKRI